MKKYGLSLVVISFCMSAMENQWQQKALAIKNKLVELDTHQRKQFAQRGASQKGKVYQEMITSLAQAQQKAKELKKNCLPEYEVYKRYHRSCPNRAAVYPACPGQKWRECPMCYHVFKDLSKPTQQYIEQKKVILAKKWHLHIIYGENIKLANYYYDVQNPQNDLLRCNFQHHDLKEDEEKMLQTNLPILKEKWLQKI